MRGRSSTRWRVSKSSVKIAPTNLRIQFHMTCTVLLLTVEQDSFCCPKCHVCNEDVLLNVQYVHMHALCTCRYTRRAKIPYLEVDIHFCLSQLLHFHPVKYARYCVSVHLHMYMYTYIHLEAQQKGALIRTTQEISTTEHKFYCMNIK